MPPTGSSAPPSAPSVRGPHHPARRPSAARTTLRTPLSAARAARPGADTTGRRQHVRLPLRSPA